MSSNYRIVCFDVETTGKDPMTCRPTEFGAVIRNVDGSVTEINFLIKNKEFKKGMYEKLDPVVIRITGIDDDMLKNEGLEMQDAMDRVAEILGIVGEHSDVRTVIVAHNLFSYDLKVVKRWLKECGYDWEVANEDLFDTAMHYKSILGSSPRKQGETVFEHQQRMINKRLRGWTLAKTAQYYKVPFNDKAHRALADARPTMGVFYKQMKEVRKTNELLEAAREKEAGGQQKLFN